MASVSANLRPLPQWRLVTKADIRRVCRASATACRIVASPTPARCLARRPGGPRRKKPVRAAAARFRGRRHDRRSSPGARPALSAPSSIPASSAKCPVPGAARRSAGYPGRLCRWQESARPGKSVFEGEVGRGRMARDRTCTCCARKTTFFKSGARRPPSRTRKPVRQKFYRMSSLCSAIALVI